MHQLISITYRSGNFSLLGWQAYCLVTIIVLHKLYTRPDSKLYLPVIIFGTISCILFVPACKQFLKNWELSKKKYHRTEEKNAEYFDVYIFEQY